MGDSMSGGLIIGGDTSGSIALVPAAIAGSTTITIAAKSGTLNVAGPAFYTSASAATSVASSAYVKIGFNTVTFDTASCFDTTNNRFVPNVAGYYQINAGIQYNGPSTTSGFALISLGKNGSVYTGGQNLITAIQYAIPSTSGLIYLNGTTDYVEIYGYQSQGSTQTMSGQFFQGFLARTA